MKKSKKPQIKIPNNLVNGDQLLLSDGDTARVHFDSDLASPYFKDGTLIAKPVLREVNHDCWLPNGKNQSTDRYVVGIERKRKQAVRKPKYDMRDDKPMIAVSFRFIRDVRRWQKQLAAGTYSVTDTKRLADLLVKFMDAK